MQNSVPRKRLPVNPSLEYLRKQAKRLAKTTPDLPLTKAQHRLAQEYGCKHWAELVRTVRTMSIGANELASSGTLAPLPKASNEGDIAAVRHILAVGSFTQHDLDLALARATLILSQRPERRPLAELLLEHGADPDGQYGSNYGPIILAACECIDFDGIEFLVRAGADVSFDPIKNKYAKDITPINVLLGTYVRGRNEAKHRCIDFLIEHGAQWQDDAVMAVHRGDAQGLDERVKSDPSLMQLRFGAESDSRRAGNIGLEGATLLHLAVEYGEKECVDVLLSHYRGFPDAETNSPSEIINGIGGQTPIYHAISRWDRSTDMLEHFLRRVGQYVDMEVSATFRRFGEAVCPALTPLAYALQGVDENNMDAAKKRELALLRGADRKSRLKTAIRREDVAAVSSLLDAHPELLEVDLWPVAIYQTQSLAMTQLLLSRGLDPNKCSAPRLPLHLAVYRVLPEIVQALIAAGADVERVNVLGERPLELLDIYEPRPAHAPEMQRVRQILLQAGAGGSKPQR